MFGYNDRYIVKEPKRLVAAKLVQRAVPIVPKLENGMNMKNLSNLKKLTATIEAHFPAQTTVQNCRQYLQKNVILFSKCGIII